MSNDYQGQVIDFYALRHDYDSDFTEARALKLVNYLYLQKKQSVLNVGTGFIAVATRSLREIAIAPKVKSVIGVDFTPAMIARAEKKLEALNIENIDLINADIAVIDFAESSFDLITCSMAIALFPHIPQVLAKWYQWLKKGGSIATAAEIATLVNNYRREIEKNATAQGVWQDATTFFVTASKS